MSQYGVSVLSYTHCSSERPGYISDLSSDSSSEGGAVVIREANAIREGRM